MADRRNLNNKNIRDQAGQMPGDDVTIVGPRIDGDTEIWGNWTYNSPNAVDALTKLSSVTDTGDTQYYSIPNLREVHRSIAGAVAVGTGQFVTTLGSNSTWGGGFSQSYNFIDSGTIDATGMYTVTETGLYEVEYWGNVLATGGTITTLQALIRINAAYSGLGGVIINSAGFGAAPYQLKAPVSLTVGDTIKPAYNISMGLGSCAINNTVWKITPLFFV